jgi:FkbM family methyltransferase
MKSFLRKLARALLQFYPREYGKYSILQKLYFPYLSSSNLSTEVVRMRAGFRLYLRPVELLQAHLYLFSTYELPTTNFVRRFLKEGDVVLDIGANIGYMSLFFAQCVGTSGKVYAFEPEQENYQALLANIALNSAQNIMPQRQAATDVEKMLKLYLAQDNFGAHSTVFNDETLTDKYEEIQGAPLDTFVQKNQLDKIALVKIDVEGAEYEVLQGMKQILKQQRPILIVELNDSLQRKRGLSFASISEELKTEYDYQFFSTTESGHLIESQKHEFENSIFIPTEKMNQFKSIVL